MKPKQPPILQYVCLALLFGLASWYQARSTLYSFPGYFRVETVRYPFFAGYEHGRPVLSFVSATAQVAGVKEKDVLVAVNNHPLTGLAVLGEAMRHAKPGDTLVVSVLTPGGKNPRPAFIPLERAISPDVAWATATLWALKLVMPTFSILLGFWVAAVRPRDPSA